MSQHFSIQSLKQKKIIAMKTKNDALKNIINLTLGDADTLLKNHPYFINDKGQEISEEQWIKGYISKILKNLESNLVIYKERKDVFSVEKVQAEISSIQTEFFPPLSKDEINLLIENYIKEHPEENKPKGFMEFLSENYFGRYNGKEVAPLFMASIKR